MSLFILRIGEFVKADFHLDQLPKSVNDWVTQRKALIQAAVGGYAGTETALKKLTKESDLRVRAALLSRLPFKKDRLALIDVLKEIESSSKLHLTQKERLQLAQLYETTGDWLKSRETVQFFLEEDPLNPQLIEYAVLALLRHYNEDDSIPLKAEELVGRLEGLELNSFRTITIKARLLVAQDNADEARDLLKQYFGQFLDEQKDRQKLADLNLKVASLLEELGQFQAADEMYRKYVELSPEKDAVLQLISFLGRRKKHAEAIDLCEKSWDTIETRLLALVAMATIRNAKEQGHHVQQIEQRLKLALKDDPKSLPLLLILADLRDYQGQYEQVEKIYRRMLEINQNNIVVLNNFAWFVAMRYQKGNKALSLIDRAISRSGPIPELLDTRAVVLLAANKPQEALKSLNEAIDLKPSPIKTFHLAQVYSRLSKIPESKKALKKAEDEGLNWDQMHPLEREELKKLKQKLEK